MREVVAGILLNNRRQLFVAQRPLDKSFPGCWEFPGGKVEQGESRISALNREFFEELAMETESENWQPFFSKGAGDFHIYFFIAYTDAEYAPQAVENQPAFAWKSLSELRASNFLKSNEIVLEKLQALLAT